MHINNQIALLALALLTNAAIASRTVAQAAQVVNLRCEYQENPVGIDAVQPQLSWNITSTQRSERQTAYQILVASTPERLAANNGDLWNSGKVASSQSAYIPYAGAALRSRMRCFWKARVWDKNSQVSAWSPGASWTMGLLRPEDWSAKWITPAHWFLPPDMRPHGLEVGANGWADVDLGSPLPLQSLKLTPFSAATFPLRFQILGAEEPQFTHPQTLLDQTAQDFHPTGTGPQEFPLGGAKARYVRLFITGSPNGHSVVRQMEIFSGGRNVALMRPTKEYGTEWSRGHSPFLVDGLPERGQGDVCPPDACPTTAAPLLRKSFTLPKSVKRATLYVAALGMADMTLNGQKIGEDVLGPPFSDYTKRVFYVTHDITPLLVKGENVLGATLGNGYFSTPHLGFGQRQGGNGPPRLLAQAEIEFTDGTRRVIGTDDTWKWSRSEITDNDLWVGYSEDRRLARPGWDTPGYAAAGWLPVGITQALGGKLCAPMGPPVRVLGALKPVSVAGNEAHFDVLSAGWPRVMVNGKAGQTITVTGNGPGFTLPKFTFTLAADGPAVLEPRFVLFSGPLTLSVDGLTEPLTAQQVSIQRVNADLEPASAFTCSNPFLNKIYDAALRTHRNYVFDVPADPTREKQGWTQDAQNMFDAAAYFTDVAGLYRKWWWDMADNQDSSGYLGSVVPVVGRQVYDWNSPWWSGVLVFLPWEQYQYYGNRRILEEAYEPMRRYVDFLGTLTASGARPKWADYPYFNLNVDTTDKSGMLIWNGAGDWQNPYTKTQLAVPTPMTTMPAWYDYAVIVSQTAALLGKPADAARYAAVAEQVKDRFNAQYFHPETGLYGEETNSQTAQALPLGIGLVPPDKRPLAYQRLIDAIHARDDHLGTGFVALPFLLQTLTNAREASLANKIVNQQTYPGWATLMHDGILGEGWHGGGAQMPSLGGCVGMWLFQSVLGIRPDPAGPGFQKFLLAPQPDPATGLTSAGGYYDCVHGRIGSDWKIDAGRFTLHATVPANTTATLILPTRDEKSVRESGRPAATADGVRFLRMEGHAAVYQVGSGDYHFDAAY